MFIPDSLVVFIAHKNRALPCQLPFRLTRATIVCDEPLIYSLAKIKVDCLCEIFPVLMWEIILIF